MAVEEEDSMLSRPQRPLDFVSRTYAGFTTAIMVPVIITVLAVVWSVQNLSPIYAGRNTQPLFIVASEKSSASPAEKLGDSLLNALVVVTIIGVVTFLMVLLYKCNCIKVIVVWFVVSSALIFFFLCWVWCDLYFTRFQITYDYVTMVLALWNFGVVGNLSLFYYGHPKIMQSYLVVLSVIMGWLLTRLPEWTTWAILLAVAIYDIVAVLCPGGPLALLVKEAQARNEQIPGFIYDSGGTDVMSNHQPTTVAVSTPPIETTNYTCDKTPAPERPLPHRDPPVSESPATPPVNPPGEELELNLVSSEGGADDLRAATGGDRDSAMHDRVEMDLELEDDDEISDPFDAAPYARPFKLGLGDFIFYSLLVGRTSSFSFVSWVTALLFVGVGLIGTLCSLMFLRGKVPALPALPISIFSGMLSYFVFRYTVVPLCYFVSTEGIML